MLTCMPAKPHADPTVPTVSLVAAAHGAELGGGNGHRAPICAADVPDTEEAADGRGAGTTRRRYRR